MPDMPGDTFISKGIKYILLNGPKGNLRPYTVGPVSPSPLWGWAALVVAGVVLAAGVLTTALGEDDS